MEIYCEHVRDLLRPASSKSSLRVRYCKLFFNEVSYLIKFYLSTTHTIIGGVAFINKIIVNDHLSLSKVSARWFKHCII